MEEHYNELVEWVVLKKKLNTPADLTQDLVDTGVLDSLFFVEYILMIEDLSGTEIEVGEELLEKTRTLQAVRENFFMSAA